MKMISIVVPSFNEQENIADLYSRTSAVMRELSGYDFEIIFIDDGSTDKTRSIIEDLCKTDGHIKAIFSARNFGYSKTIFYGLQQAQGDCAILLHADLQNPPEVIPEFVEQWENGYKIVLGVKSRSKENKLMFFFRKCYYSLMNRISDIEHISQATDFELLDKSFLDVLRAVHVNTPYLRGLIMEYGYDIKQVEYTQDKRAKGKTHFNFYKYYDFAMLGITSTSKKVLRLATLFGLFFTFAATVIIIVSVILQIMSPGESTQFITWIIIEALLLVSGLQFVFIGLLGEYVLSIIGNASNKPVVTEAGRINFTNSK
jgi:polyisoprenyl-phosphate glycosyltransferase